MNNIYIEGIMFKFDIHRELGYRQNGSEIAELGGIGQIRLHRLPHRIRTSTSYLHSTFLMLLL